VKSFLGEHQHSLDTKGRLILPADFRGPLAEGAVIGPGQQECLVVFTLEEWGKVAERLEAQLADGTASPDAARAFFSGAREVKPDGQGRVLIAPHQRTYARLERDVVVAGVYSRIEIWDAGLWDDRKRDGQATLAAASSSSGIRI
jgi:transcriptional regulator MraZ